MIDGIVVKAAIVGKKSRNDAAPIPETTVNTKAAREETAPLGIGRF
jgi:hypothetical protein